VVPQYFFFRASHAPVHSQSDHKGAHEDSAEEFDNIMRGSRSACVEERRELEEEWREVEEAVSDGAKLYKLDRSRYRHLVYLLYWYKRTNTDAAATIGLNTDTQFTCFTGTKGQILTQLQRQV
jgi:hypothetical protein